MTKEPVWQKAKGEYIFDTTGKKYLDFTSGVMVTNLGHANKIITKAIVKNLQIPLIYGYRYPFLQKEKFEKELLNFLDNKFSEICLATTGAEAVEDAMMICARSVGRTGRNLFVTFSNAYHGKTLGASFLSGIDRYKSKILNANESSLVRRINYPVTTDEEKNVVKDLDRFSKKAIAVFVECLQGSTLLKMNTDFLKDLRKWCTKNGALLVVDEIQTGFYRVGPKFSYLESGIVPDMVCLGKGLTSSLPLSVVALNEKLAKFTSPELDASTHSGNPLSIAASRACLKEYQSQNFLKKLEISSRNYGFMMKKISNSVLKSVEVKYYGGLWGGLIFSGADGQRKALSFVNQCRKHGLFIPMPVGQKENIVKFTPPLTINKLQLDFATNVILRCLYSLKLLESSGSVKNQLIS